MNETRVLTHFCSDMSYEHLLQEVIETAKDAILESSQIHSRIILDYMKKLEGRSESTVLVDGCKLPSQNAALANGSFGHGLELDDVVRALL